MSKRSNIFESLKDYIPDDSKDNIIESRSQHVISSAIHLVEAIESHYGEEEAEMLKKRLISSIKNGDSKRFTRAIRKIKEDKK